ncbi:MAG: alpha-ketoglutarate-dependent dioxygenase AlkB [Anaerolineae bacterium]|jgi:alkylated DNA repair dioxygenase AlkB|nr:alpha-ketoglutarate-dependent dioxygenase AlkB [Anaerolineae bacterium]
MIPGLRYLADYLSIEQHDQLVTILDQQIWSTELKRRVQQYGYRYDYRARQSLAEMSLGPFPAWLQLFADQVGRDLMGQTPDQVIINEYQPGQGIAPHIDCQPCYGDTILSVSLLSGCVMTFSRGEQAHPVWLAPRSVVIMQGEARQLWKHGIARVKNDTIDGQSIPRGRRISITLRKMRFDH